MLGLLLQIIYIVLSYRLTIQYHLQCPRSKSFALWRILHDCKQSFAANLRTVIAYERLFSHPVVELAIAEMACVSWNIRRTLHVPSVVSVQCFSPERSVSYPVKLSSKRHRLKPFEFSPHGLTDRLRLNCEPSSPMNAFSHILWSWVRLRRNRVHFPNHTHIVFYDACVGLVQWSISNREDSHPGF